MAYNSDGYIMFDFSNVNFSRTNQTIDGIYKKCREIIGTNKFIIVINANSQTPLPSVCSFVNNQYVIASVPYSFTISSDDNLLIKKNTTASELIDDAHKSDSTTWSSNKIDEEIKAIIDDDESSESATYSSDKIDDLLSSLSSATLSANAFTGSSTGSTEQFISYELKNVKGIIIIDYTLRYNINVANGNIIELCIYKNDNLVKVLTTRGSSDSFRAIEEHQLLLMDNAVVTDVYKFSFRSTQGSTISIKGNVDYILF